MRFTSTRGAEADSFAEVVLRGAAPDGGLFGLNEIPNVSDLIADLPTDRNGDVPSFVAFATALFERLLPGDAPGTPWSALLDRAYDFAPVLRRVGELWILELFHGPSCAFKDYGARFLASFLDAELARRGEELVILTATSGDTGSAVGQAFRSCRAIQVVILFPKGRISRLQQQQLTTIGGNVHAVEVAGSFDDCQRMVKESFADAALSREVPLSSANSINLGRLLPQSVYYLYTAACLRDIGSPVFCVPSGNFGNLTAGLMARRAGMSSDRFIAATNVNDVVPNYLKAGDFQPRNSVETISNAMDVGNPSNFERMQALFDGDLDRIRAVVRGEVVTDDQTRDTMRRFLLEHDEFICPHTAVGVAAAGRHLDSRRTPSQPVVVLATAHPGKFPEVVREATGKDPEIPERLSRLLEIRGESCPMSPHSAKLSELLRHIYANR